MASTREGGKRIPIVDALRGWALLGVVLVNFAIFYNLGNDTRIPEDDTASRVAKLLTQVFFQAKGWTLLAFLFGYGFSVLIERLNRREHPVRAFTLRMFWLFVIALVNCALYYGDVLKDYVLVGMVILAFRRVSARAAAGLSLACLLAFPALISWSRGLALENPIAMPDLALYQSHNPLDVLRYGLTAGLHMSLSVSKLFDWNLVMLACAFAGMACQRFSFFETLADRRRQLKFWCFGALAFAIASAGLNAGAQAAGLNPRDHYDISLVADARADGVLHGRVVLVACGGSPAALVRIPAPGRPHDSHQLPDPESARHADLLRLRTLAAASPAVLDACRDGIDRVRAAGGVQPAVAGAAATRTCRERVAKSERAEGGRDSRCVIAIRRRALAAWRVER